jgi:hypothetical protein
MRQKEIPMFSASKCIMVCAAAALIAFAAPDWTTAGPPNKAPRPRKQLPLAERFERAIGKNPQENPLLAATIHSVDRYLQGAQDLSELDKALHARFAAAERDRKISRKTLQKLVDNWNSLPQALRNKVTPAELRNLSANKKLNTQTLRKAMDATAPKMLGLNKNLAVMPQIKAVHPSTGAGSDADGTPRLIRGKSFVIDTDRVPLDTSRLKVRFLEWNEQNGTLTDQVAATVAPALKSAAIGAGTAALMATVPANLEWGHYKVQIEISGAGPFANKTNAVRVHVPSPNFKIQPLVNVIEPAARYPGSMATIKGGPFLPTTEVVLESLDEEGVGPLILTQNGADAPLKRVDGTTMSVTVPQWVPPGHYLLTHRAKGSKIQSTGKAFTVRAPKYRVEFEKIQCVKETDGGGTDDIVVVWTPLVDYGTVALLPKSTGEYEMDNNVTKPFLTPDRLTFGSGVAVEVKKELNLQTTLIEADGDEAQEIKNVIVEIGGALASVGAVIGNPYVAAAGAVVSLVGEIYGVVAGAGYNLGTKEPKYTVADLQKATWDAKHHTVKPQGDENKVSFWDPSGDNGYKYVLHYRILREQKTP